MWGPHWFVFFLLLVLFMSRVFMCLVIFDDARLRIYKVLEISRIPGRCNIPPGWIYVCFCLPSSYYSSFRHWDNSKLNFRFSEGHLFLVHPNLRMQLSHSENEEKRSWRTLLVDSGPHSLCFPSHVRLWSVRLSGLTNIPRGRVTPNSSSLPRPMSSTGFQLGNSSLFY